MNNRFNLSDWALEHRSLVWYFMIVFVVAGVLAYITLGREEDPAFTIKTMVIQANGPAPRSRTPPSQVTDRIEKKLEELDIARLHQEPDHAGPDHDLRQPAGHDQSRDVPADLGAGAQHDRRHQAASFPRGVVGPFFNDRLRRRVRQHLRLHRRRPDRSASCATMSRTRGPRF